MACVSRAFFFFFFAVLAVHFGYVKAPAQERTIASTHQVAKPWYDASWKY